MVLQLVEGGIDFIKDDELQANGPHYPRPEPSEAHEDAELPGLIAEVEATVAVVCGELAYDAFDVHAAILARGAQPAIPASKGAAVWPPAGRPDVPPTRGAAVARAEIEQAGRTSTANALR